MRTFLLTLILLVVSCATAPVSWTPELVAATQANFDLVGTWRYTVREGGEFGKRCDYMFEGDGTYRKSCKPPVEERGEWSRVGEWDENKFTLKLVERVNLIENKPIDDAEIVVSVDAPSNDVITMGTETYEKL